MGEMGFGYGSEWHLLRYLGYHRTVLDQSIQNVMGDVQEIKWVDHPFNPNRKLLDAELKGVEFLPDDEPKKTAWKSYWPAQGNVPNWDAVARLRLMDGSCVWMLVEAKAHIGELNAYCGAKVEGGLDQIKEVLRATQRACGVSEELDWTGPYYQHANRLAAIHFFSGSARLLNIYFTGDTNPSGDCPKSEAEWKLKLQKRDKHMGLIGCSKITEQVKSLFLPVCRTHVDDNGHPLPNGV